MTQTSHDDKGAKVIRLFGEDAPSLSDTELASRGETVLERFAVKNKCGYEDNGDYFNGGLIWPAVASFDHNTGRGCYRISLAVEPPAPTGMGASFAPRTYRFLVQVESKQDFSFKAKHETRFDRIASRFRGPGIEIGDLEIDEKCYIRASNPKILAEILTDNAMRESVLSYRGFTLELYRVKVKEGKKVEEKSNLSLVVDDRELEVVHLEGLRDAFIGAIEILEIYEIIQGPKFPVER